jgi:glycosyl transferase family 87
MNARFKLLWCGSAVVVAATTGWAMYREITTFGRPENIQTGLDFANNTWRAVRDLLSGVNIYGPTHAVIPGIGPAWPVSQHVPGSLLWQAPFAALPLPAALFTYTFVSVLAIWAGVFVLTWPRDPSAVFLAACCGGFAIGIAGGPMALLLGQPTGFMLLGLAVLVRARQPWLAGLGFMLAASTIQAGLPLALALLLLGGWRVVWRGAALALGCSLPVVGLEIANAGFSAFVNSFVVGGSVYLVRVNGRIDLGGLLFRVGGAGKGVQLAISLLLASVALIFLARLPPHLRRIGHPPVLSFVVAFMLLSAYHESYDLLLVGGAVVPAILVNDRSRAMLPAFGLAGTSAGISSSIAALFYAPLALLGVGISSALALRRAAASDARTGADRAEASRPAGDPPMAPGLLAE